MLSQKLKRVFLGVIAFLMLASIIWYDIVVLGRISLRSFNFESRMFSKAVAFSAALVSITGLYLIAKILIEIFKKEGSEQQNH
jgi:hypothetical protein